MYDKLENSFDDLDEFQRRLDEAARSLDKLRSMARRACARRLDMLLSPISALPPEVLGDIFLYVVVPRAANILPILLVSSWWSQVASGREALWSHLFIHQSRLQLFEYPLSRSGHSSLHIELETANLGQLNSLYTRYPRALQISERLKSMTLICPAGSRNSGLDVFVEDFEVGLSILDTLTIISSLSPPLQTNIPLDFPMPRLDRLGLKRATITVPDNHTSPLNHLTINDVYMPETSFRELLGHFPFLSTLHLTQFRCRQEPNDESPRLLPALKHLKFSAMHPAHIATILKSVIITQLRSLSINIDFSQSSGGEEGIGLRVSIAA